MDVENRDSHVDISINVGDIPATIEHRALSSPGLFLGRIARGEGPFVVLPDGKVVHASFDLNKRELFSWAIAKLYAKKENGICLQGGLTSDNQLQTFPYKDFIEAERRLALASTIPKIKELAKDGQTWNRLSEDAYYLQDVAPWSIQDVFTRNVMDAGVNGSITSGDKVCQYGHQKNSCPLELCLFMHGFGYSHLRVSGRRIVAEFRTNPLSNENKEDSEKKAAIRQFLSGYHEKGIKYSYPERDSDKFMLRMQSSAENFGDNYDLNEQIQSTKEMLEIFVPLVEKLSGAFVKMDERLNSNRNRKISRILDIINE